MLDYLRIPLQEQLGLVEDILVNELASGVEGIDSIARYVVKNGGKRIRPALFLLAARMAGASGDGLPKLAAALEMLHTASLLHDDVIDDATIRRGQPSAKAKWGNQVSVLVGDLLFCRASKMIVSYGNQRLSEAMVEALSATTGGELLEIAHQNNVETDAATYMKIIKGKTAAIFAVAAKSGAIVAEVERSFEEALEGFGLAIGQAFQLSDDALDYVADETHFGKTQGTDLREGKLTYPLIVAFSKATQDERVIIRNALISGRQPPEKFREVVAIIEKYDGIAATWRLARQLSDEAKRMLELFKPSIERESLVALADYVVERRE